MKKYLAMFLILISPMVSPAANAHGDPGGDTVPAATGENVHALRSTKDVPYEYVDIAGGGRYGAVRVSFGDSHAVGMVGKYQSSKGVQFTRHTHTDWVVVTVLSGRVEVVRQDGTDVRVYDPGDTYLVDTGETHIETSLEDDTVVVVVNGPAVNNEQFNMRTIAVDATGAGDGSSN